MPKIIRDQQYNKTIVLYAASRTFERAAFYGMRSILTLYLFKGVFSLAENDVMDFYSGYIQSFVVANVIGAIFGDFILGNRKALLIGTTAMSFGLFLLCVPVKEVFYGGIGLIVLGSGLYTPNFLARFGKQFYDKPELTDGGFSVLYVLINLGAFMGTLLITFLALDNYMLGFVISGFLMMGSAVLAFITNDKTNDDSKPTFEISPTNRMLIVAATIIAVGIYWYLYGISYNGISDLQLKIQEFNPQLNISSWNNLSSGLAVFIGILVAVAYTFIYIRRAFKMALGLILSAIGLGILLFVEIPVTEMSALIMFVSLALLSAGEMIMAPVIYTLVTQKTNPKFLALVMSLTFVPLGVLKFFGPTLFGGVENSLPLQATAALVAVMGVVFLIVWIIKRPLRSSN